MPEGTSAFVEDIGLEIDEEPVRLMGVLADTVLEAGRSEEHTSELQSHA